MRLTGTLSSWKDDRGFGFIAPTHGGAELFVHISALPRDGSRPTVGERLTYELGRGKNGQAQAVNVQRAAIGRTSESPRLRRTDAKKKRSFSFPIALCLVLVLGAIALAQYPRWSARLTPPPQPSVATPHSAEATQGFRCDGRTHCSQMTSCAEAKFFLKNCPGTQMDGNSDGTPCEQQWCTTPFSN